MRRLHDNPARTVEELPDDVYVAIVTEENELTYVYYSDDSGRELRSSRSGIMDEAEEQNFSGTVELTYLWDCDAYEVTYALAAHGWGPLLYDVAMEFASARASGLRSDRASLSKQACAVWDRYIRRPDVTSRPAPEVCAPAVACEGSNRIFTKRPARTIAALEQDGKLVSPAYVQLGASRPLAANPARTLDDLPEDVRIAVVESFSESENRIRTFTVYYADARGYPFPSSRDRINDPNPERYFSGVVRTLYKPACNAYEVVYSMAAPGWGPLLYDVAIELASQYGGGLMSDRNSVSDAACRVWERYRGRPEIAKRALPRTVCVPKAPCSTPEAFTKSPELLHRLERERKILYFDDKPPGASHLIPMPDPEDYAAKARDWEPAMAKPKPLSMVANARARRAAART